MSKKEISCCENQKQVGTCKNVGRIVISLFASTTLLISTAAKAECDFVFEGDIEGEEVKLVKAPSWASPETFKELILPQNIMSQALGFERIGAKGTPDGVWELCQAPNKLFLRYGVKSEWFDGVHEAYDLKSGFFAKGKYEKGLRVGTWEFKDDTGIHTERFENGLPVSVMGDDESRKTMAFLEIFASSMDKNVLNPAIQDSVEKQNVSYQFDTRSKKVDQGLDSEKALVREGFQKFNEGLEQAMKELQRELQTMSLDD